MREHFDLVAVKFEGSPKVSLFEAPVYSHISIGDFVEVEDHDTKAEVVAVNDINLKYDDDEFEFVVAATNTTLPLKKVTARIYKERMKYDE